MPKIEDRKGGVGGLKNVEREWITAASWPEKENIDNPEDDLQKHCLVYLALKTKHK